MKIAAALLVPVILLGALAYMHRPAYDPAVPVALDPDWHSILMAHRVSSPQLVFLGDSVVHRWDYRPHAWQLLASYNPANLGEGGDRIDNVMWRVQHGELDGIHPRYIVVLVGANDIAGDDPPFYKHQTLPSRRLLMRSSRLSRSSMSTNRKRKSF